MKCINCSSLPWHYSCSPPFLCQWIICLWLRLLWCWKNKILSQCSRLCKAQLIVFHSLAHVGIWSYSFFSPAAWPELLSLLKRSPQRDALIIPLTNNGYWWARWWEHHAVFCGFEGCEVMCLLWWICGELLVLLHHDCLYTRHSGEETLHHGFLRLATSSCATETGPIATRKTLKGLLNTDWLDLASQHLLLFYNSLLAFLMSSPFTPPSILEENSGESLVATHFLRLSIVALSFDSLFVAFESSSPSFLSSKMFNSEIQFNSCWLQLSTACWHSALSWFQSLK